MIWFDPNKFAKKYHNILETSSVSVLTKIPMMTVQVPLRKGGSRCFYILLINVIE